MSDPVRPKKRRWLLIFFVLLMMGFFLLPVIGAGMLVAGLSKAKAIEQGTALTLGFSGSMGESPVDPFLAKIGQGPTESVWSLRDGLRRAAKDDRITSLLLVIEPVSMGWAQAEEIVEEIDLFRASGKPVYAYLRVDMLQEKEYFLATAADRIWLTPGAAVMLNGLAAEVTFWRGTFDKLKIEPEVMMFHEYKSAGEPFKNKEMSPYFREALSAVLDDMHAAFIKRTAERRKVTPEVVASFIARGIAVDTDLKDAGLVDELGYVDEIRDLLEGLDSSPGKGEFKSVSVASYLDAPTLPETATERIAVIFGEGPIVASSGSGGLFSTDKTIHGPEVASIFRDAIEDDAIKAIVFRVSSPGGSAVGSDLVWREIQRARAAGKPVVVSMSDVAGSGGYWISMGADAIVAHPTTITGSIGVVFQKFNVSGLMEWAGAHTDLVTTGERADVLSFAKPLGEDGEALVRAWMSSIYGQFTQKVAQGRDLPLEKVQQIAKGRIWSGEDALELGLVNELGGMDVAIARARALAKLSDTVPVVPFPASTSFLERVLSGDLNVVMPMFGLNLPDEAALHDALVELGRPQVQVVMPDISVR